MDAAPILLASQASLDDLNSRLKTPVPMNRFRPNIVIEGCEAFEEDERPEFRFPDIILRRVTVCERCIVTTMDQQTGTRDKEPLNTLSRYRRRSENYAGGIMFGIYLTGGEGRISTGDQLAEK